MIDMTFNSVIPDQPYHNVPEPPKNPQPTEDPAAPSTESPINLDNRFNPVWDSEDLSPNSISNFAGKGKRDNNFIFSLRFRASDLF